MGSPNTNIYKVQMTYFFKENSDFKSFGLMSSLYNQLNGIFHTEPQSLPIPNDAPSDVPRCIWSDVNTNLTFNKLRLDFSFNVPSKFKWNELFASFNQKIAYGLAEHDIIIDRVGIVGELMSLDNLHEVLKDCINIPQFNDAKEANISWLENMEGYNVWTYFMIDENQNINKIVFDINSLPERRLSEQGIPYRDAMMKCVDFLERKMKHVL